MSPVTLTPPPESNEEIVRLIETLHSSERRLAELTAGQVDAVANRQGQPLLSMRCRPILRYSTCRDALLR